MKERRRNLDSLKKNVTGESSVRTTGHDELDIILQTAKEQAVVSLKKKLRDLNTFQDIAAEIRRSDEYVRLRLVPIYKTNPNALIKTAKGYLVPRSTAEAFIEKFVWESFAA